jgi:hypothetical protein
MFLFSIYLRVVKGVDILNMPLLLFLFLVLLLLLLLLLLWLRRSISSALVSLLEHANA